MCVHYKGVSKISAWRDQLLSGDVGVAAGGNGTP